MDINNKAAYEKKYGNAGYGLRAPDGHIIRIYKQILEYQLGMKGGSVLDYGTGNGIHLGWLANQGDWKLYGVDISEIAIKQAKRDLAAIETDLQVTGQYPDLVSLYGENKFDLIIANQVLYYVDNKELDYLVMQFEKVLKLGGVFYASMMGIENFYYKQSAPYQVANDFREVKLTGRLNETTLINFKTREDMLKDFSRFNKLHAGYYDTIIREDEGSTMHHFYIGQKK